MKYLLKKEGYYYRPESSGYTQHPYAAGIFDEEYALNHAKSCDEVFAIPLSEMRAISIAEAKEVAASSSAFLLAVEEAKKQGSDECECENLGSQCDSCDGAQ